MSIKQDIKKEYFGKAEKLIDEWLAKLPHTKEDEEKIKKILKFYSRKRNVTFGNVYNLTAAVMWVYARVNFMGEAEGKMWRQKELAELCGVSKSTMGQKSRKIMKDLKIDIFDQRFSRESVVDKNPLLDFCVDPRTGMLLSRKDSLDAGIPLKRSKSDYYYDAMEYLNVGDAVEAIKLLRKSIEIDEHYVEAYVGMAFAYRNKGNKKTATKYADLAFEKTKRVFPKWPKELLWGFIENRQYLRAIDLKAYYAYEAGDKKEAEKLYRLLLKLNPNDNQGIRYILAGMFIGLNGNDIDDMFNKGNEEQNWDDLENLVEEQNEIHKFWVPPVFD